MAAITQRRGKFELRVKHDLLPRGVYYATFATEAEARDHGNQLEAMLAQREVPHELAASRVRLGTETLAKVMLNYEAAVAISALDTEVLALLRPQIGAVRADEACTYVWSERWVRALKLERHLAPGTIRKRVGALARLLDWYLKRQAKAGEQPISNPLRLLPKNYSVYNARERELLDKQGGHQAKFDQSRDRRLQPGEEARIVAALEGAKHPDRQRPLALTEGPALRDLFLLLVHTGLRLREAYTLRVQDVRLNQRTLHIRQSKTGMARDVPLVPAVFALLERRMELARAAGPKAAIFPWWCEGADGKELRRVTLLVGNALAHAFAYAGCHDLTTHDLRHEATCRWILMRDERGNWLFRSEEVMRITGHKDPRVFMRYVSLRGSDLADRLWVTRP